MTDEALSCLRSAREGDREAAEKLVNDNSGLIWSVARRFSGAGWTRTTYTSSAAWAF